MDSYQRRPTRIVLAPALSAMKSMALMLTLLFALAMSVAEAAPKADAAPTSGVHVYLFRGLLNVFSLGMDEIAAKLRKQGLEVSVYNHTSWPSVSDKAAVDYKAGRLTKIILVGHSAGATAVTSVVNRLGELGVPVTLAIGLDPAHRRTVTGQASLYVNYYIGNGLGVPVAKGKNFRGRLENVNRTEGALAYHFGIDKDDKVQAQIIKMIHDAL